jgi:gluconolactonase
LLSLFLAITAVGQGIPGVVAADAKVELVQEGFLFTEGALGAADGGLFFSDLQTADKTYRMDASGKISVYREHTGGTNGLAFNRAGELLGVEGEGKRVSKIGAGGAVTTLTEGIAGMPLTDPNDLIVDARGGVYFTDPGPRPVVLGRKAYLYYLPAGSGIVRGPDGLRHVPLEPRILDDQITRPNGLTLTNNGKTLIVDDTVGDTVFAFDVQADGSVKNKRAFAHIHDVEAGKESGADGMAIDTQDRIYITSSTGVQVFDPKGQYLGTIKVPRQPSNLAFGGRGKKTLFITARQGLYRLNMLSEGTKRLGK